MVHAAKTVGTADLDMLSEVQVRVGSLGTQSPSCHGTVPESMVEPPCYVVEVLCDRLSTCHVPIRQVFNFLRGTCNNQIQGTIGSRLIWEFQLVALTACAGKLRSHLDPFLTEPSWRRSFPLQEDYLIIFLKQQSERVRFHSLVSWVRFSELCGIHDPISISSIVSTQSCFKPVFGTVVANGLWSVISGAVDLRFSFHILSASETEYYCLRSAFQGYFTSNSYSSSLTLGTSSLRIFGKAAENDYGLVVWRKDLVNLATVHGEDLECATKQNSSCRFPKNLLGTSGRRVNGRMG